jgi:hypothetical protein
VAWAVNVEGDEERLIVVLSTRALSDAELAERARARASLSADDWVHEYVLPKRRRSGP